MSSHQLSADLKVDQFGIVIDDNSKRLDFPRAEAEGVEGQSGGVRYGARELVFDKLRMHLDRMHWSAETGSAGPLYLRDDAGRLELTIDRVEMPRGLMIARAAAGGVEILAQHASLSDVRLTIPSLAAFEPVATTALARAAEVPLRQSKLRFLDAVSGRIAVTLEVELDLPVIGIRTLNQKLDIPVENGSLDFRALENSLDWLEGKFVDLGVEDRQLILSWRVPIFSPSSKDLVLWPLDDDAYTQATFDRVPLRSLTDFRMAPPKNGRAETDPPDKAKRKSRLRKLTVADIDIKLSLAAPKSVDFGGGTVLFGGDDGPGIVDLAVIGSLTHPPGPGGLRGTIGLLDVTAKDVHAGPMIVTVDRLHVGAIEEIELVFDGFRPVGLTCHITRATATNLSLSIGGGSQTTR
jgi:hypothetical protein